MEGCEKEIRRRECQKRLSRNRSVEKESEEASGGHRSEVRMNERL